MKAKNLRIGNKVDLYGSTATIQCVDFVKHYSSVDENFDRFKPIPLTEEWLISFGFEDETYKNGYIGVNIKSNITLDFVLTKPKFMGEWQKDYQFELRESRIVGVEYVHELQNLFFAVTSTELDLKTIM